MARRGSREQRRGGPSKGDLQLAELQLEYQTRWHREEKRRELWGPPLLCLAAAAPILALAFLAQVFAGKETSVSFQGSLTLGISIAGLPALLHWLGAHRKMKEQKSEIERLRLRQQELEEKLAKVRANPVVDMDGTSSTEGLA